jgi:3-hydroxyisobutyrate dehydrogenase-like beta-hydroxyacid dehydrogenase
MLPLRQAFILAAGAETVAGRCQVLFDAMGQTVGEKPPTANLIKLSGNFLITSIIESLGETFALTRKSGIDPQRSLEILTGTLFSAPIFRTYGGPHRR